MKDVQRYVRKGIMELKEYPIHKPIQELQEEMGLDQLALMSTNENPLGPSPKALAAIQKELANINRYPDGRCTFLMREMSRRLGIAEDMITFGNGADNCISMIAGAFINEGDEVVMGDPSFPIYLSAVRAMGGQPVLVPLKEHVYDLPAMQKGIGPRTKMVVICNPNNPTGSIVGKKELNDFISELPAHVLLNLDEAYFDFVTDQRYPDGLDYVRQGHSVVVIRTFSKIFGIAALRIGYALGNQAFISVMNRVREVFPVSSVAQAAALAALDDTEFKSRVLQNNEEGKAYLYREFEKLGLDYIPTHTNFIFVDLKADSKQIADILFKKGILFKAGPLWGSPYYARVTIGTMDQNRGFIHALKDALTTVQ